MPMTRKQKLTRRAEAARQRRLTERLARDSQAAEHEPSDAPAASAPRGSAPAPRLPYKPASLLSDEDRARARAEGRYTAYGDLWIGPMPVPQAR